MKPVPNPYLKKLALLTGESDWDSAIRVFLNAQRSPEDSLEELARKLGVTRIIEEKLPFEGGLFRLTDGELIIKLNSLNPSFRRRFTLAHELGHLFLGTIPGHRGLKAGTHGNDISLERACDRIASELLMPTAETSRFVRDLGEPSPEKLRAIASQYDVSLQAAAIRVTDSLRIWKCCVGLWERYPKIRTAWFVGRRRWDSTEPDSYSLDLALESSAAVESQEVWRSGPYTSPVWLKLLRISSAGRVLGLVGFVN